MILIATAIEYNLLNALRAGTIGDDFAHDFGGCDVAATLDRGAHFLVERTGGGESAASAIVDNLRANMAARTVNAKARPLGGAFERLRVRT